MLCNRHLDRTNYNCVSVWYDDNNSNSNKIVREVIIMVIAVIEVIIMNDDHDRSEYPVRVGGWEGV